MAKCPCGGKAKPRAAKQGLKRWKCESCKSPLEMGKDGKLRRVSV